MSVVFSGKYYPATNFSLLSFPFPSFPFLFSSFPFLSPSFPFLSHSFAFLSPSFSFLSPSFSFLLSFSCPFQLRHSNGVSDVMTSLIVLACEGGGDGRTVQKIIRSHVCFFFFFFSKKKNCLVLFWVGNYNLFDSNIFSVNYRREHALIIDTVAFVVSDVIVAGLVTS